MADPRISRSAQLSSWLVPAISTAIIGIAAWTTLLAPLTARADFYLHGWESHHDSGPGFVFSLEPSFYKTDTNYDSNGLAFAPSGFDRYQRINFDLDAAFALNEFFTLYGRIDWTRNQLDATTNGGTSYGFADQSIGANFRIKPFRRSNGPNVGFQPAFDFQVQIDLATYDNFKAAVERTPALGDGTTDISFGGFVDLPLLRLENGKISVSAGAGYSFRTDDFSSAVPWSVLGKYEPLISGIVAEGGFLGYQSLRNDPNPAITPITTLRSQGSGGSYISGAINPGLINFRGDLGYLFQSGLGVKLFYQQSVWGENAPKGFMIGAGVSFRFVPESLRPREREEGGPLGPRPRGARPARGGKIGSSETTETIETAPSGADEPEVSSDVAAAAGGTTVQTEETIEDLPPTATEARAKEPEAPRTKKKRIRKIEELPRPDSGFVGYSLETKVLRINDKLNLVRIDKGTSQGVEVNQVFDIFIVKSDGELGDVVARAKVTDVRSTESVLLVIEYFREVWIEEGFAAKRVIQ